MSQVSFHRFVSGKPNTADLTAVQGQRDWDDGHTYIGGARGSLLIRDPTDATYGSDWQTKVAVDARDFGTEGDGAAIQAAVDYLCARRGGFVDLSAVNWSLDGAAISAIASAAGLGVTVRGQGMYATTVTQADPSVDVFAFGEAGQEHGDFMGLRDLTLVGGRRALSLNNCLRGTFTRLRVVGPQIGLYLQGTNESHAFRTVEIVGASLHGVYGGALNGGPGSVLDYPIVQKCEFQHIRVAGTVGGTAMVVTAGSLGVQQSSGGNRFEHLLFESNQQGSLEVSYAFNTSVDHLSTEDAPDTDNTYSSVLIDHASTVYLRHLFIGKGSGAHNFKHYLDVNSGSAFVSDSVLCAGGAAGTADVRVAGTVALTNVFITDRPALSFASVGAERLSFLVGVRDSAGAFIVWTDTDFGTISRTNDELVVGGSLRSIGTLAASQGGTAATSGSVRVSHNASGGAVVGRDTTNTVDMQLINWGGLAANQAAFGDPGGQTRIRSALGTPGGLVNGDWWVECTGTSPSRVCAIKVQDGGSTRTIASVTY